MNKLDYDRYIWESVNRFNTPQFLCFESILNKTLLKLNSINSYIPIKHWYSFKTQPVKEYLLSVKKMGMSVEVVSEYEYLAALNCGFSPEDILINGAGKWKWIKKYNIKNLNYIFDSIYDIKNISKIAKKQNWNIGIRLTIKSSRDPDEQIYSGQFGLTKKELPCAIKILRNNFLIPNIIHFHCRTMIPNSSYYYEAINETAEFCKDLKLYPKIIDIGGGLPVSTTKYRSEKSDNIDINDFTYKISKFVKEKIPSVEKLWMENGRYLTASSSILILRILDIKDRNNTRYLICDGGRINHAMVSDWECHQLETYSKKSNKNKNTCFTTICGPTCMAYDFLQRQQLPLDLEIGDLVIWHDAGAYHIPWETRFSGGLAQVIWCDNKNNLKLIRYRESFKKWWGQWI